MRILTPPYSTPLASARKGFDPQGALRNVHARRSRAPLLTIGPRKQQDTATP